MMVCLKVRGSKLRCSFEILDGGSMIFLFILEEKTEVVQCCAQLVHAETCFDSFSIILDCVIKITTLMEIKSNV